MDTNLGEQDARQVLAIPMLSLWPLKDSFLWGNHLSGSEKIYCGCYIELTAGDRQIGEDRVGGYCKGQQQKLLLMQFRVRAEEASMV